MKKRASRGELILQELFQNKRVAVDELSRRFGVNASTIRRDLEALEKKNLLQRIHGGALPVDILSYSGYSERLTFQENMQRGLEEKQAIALAAVRMLSPGESIALSPGTTTTILARTIRQMQLTHLTVVTNAVNIAMELAGLSDLTLVVTGGLLLSDFFALVGPIAEQGLGQMYVDKAFIGVTGLSLEHGLTGPNQLEALTYRATLQQARQVILLADHRKLEQVALYSIAPLDNVHVLITDKGASKPILKAVEKLGINVVVV